MGLNLMTQHKTTTKIEALSLKRKSSITTGDNPSWVTTPSFQMLTEKYFTKTESTLKGTFTRIAAQLVRHLPADIRPEWNDIFYNLLWDGNLVASTPVLANCGANRGMVVSCTGNLINDSVYGFYDSTGESAVLSQEGFGTSSYLGDIRPRGSKISRGGTASGIIPVIKQFVAMANDISQGGQRRGVWAGYVPIIHGDFWEVVNYLEHNPENLNIGWNITNEFINLLESGDEDAIQRLARALKVKLVTGKGYFFMVDRANRDMPQAMKDLGMVIHNSNLCFGPEAMVTLSDGSEEMISVLEKRGTSFLVKSAEFWDREKNEWEIVYKEAHAFMTGTKQVIELKLSNGKLLKASPDHIFYLKNGLSVIADESLGADLFGLDHEHPVTVIEIIDNDEVIQVYDLHVDQTHNYFVEGLLVTNCTEIALPNSADMSFTCVLSSLNLIYYRSWDDAVIFNSTVFLDCVVSEFLEQTHGIKGTERVQKFTESFRALGLGTLGYHTLLQQESIPFESLDAHYLNIEIFKRIERVSGDASKWLAGLLGEPKGMVGTGLRNSHRTAIAPNTSSAAIAGGVSQGIEPMYANAFVQPLTGGEVNRINPVLIGLMKKYGVYNAETIDDILDNDGSVQHVSWLSEHEREVYKTAFEINQYALVRAAANRQPHICQIQSLNLFFAAETAESYILGVHKEAILNKNILSLYYIRSTSSNKASNGTACSSCEN